MKAYRVGTWLFACSQVHVCHCYPFTYTDLQHCIWGAEQRLEASAVQKQQQQAQQQDQQQQEQQQPSQPAGDRNSPAGSCPDAALAEAAGCSSGPRTTINTEGIVMTRDTMAVSLAGNAVEVLTITAPANRGVPMAQRRGIVLSCEGGWRG